MKKISIMVPCYNEEENVVPLSEALIAMFEKDLPQYDYEILFIDNDSRDTTRVKLRALCENNKKSKRFLMQRISVSLIHRITAFYRPRVTVRFRSARISRIRLMLFRGLSQSGKKDIKLSVQ